MGRRGRGAILGVALLLLFVLGVMMDARLQFYPGMREDPLAFLFSVAQVAVGIPYFVAHALGLAAGNVKSVTFEFGNTFTAVAGLLNILVVLDAFDIATGRKP